MHWARDRAEFVHCVVMMNQCREQLRTMLAATAARIEAELAAMQASPPETTVMLANADSLHTGLEFIVSATSLSADHPTTHPTATLSPAWSLPAPGFDLMLLGAFEPELPFVETVAISVPEPWSANDQPPQPLVLQLLPVPLHQIPGPVSVQPLHTANFNMAAPSVASIGRPTNPATQT